MKCKTADQILADALKEGKEYFKDVLARAESEKFAYRLKLEAERKTEQARRLAELREERKVERKTKPKRGK